MLVPVPVPELERVDVPVPETVCVRVRPEEGVCEPERVCVDVGV